MDECCEFLPCLGHIRSSLPLSRQPDANNPAVYREMNVFSQLTYFHPEAFFSSRMVVFFLAGDEWWAPSAICSASVPPSTPLLLLRGSFRIGCGFTASTCFCRSLSLSRMCVLSRVLANSSEPVIVAYGGRLCFLSLVFMCTTA